MWIPLSSLTTGIYNKLEHFYVLMIHRQVQPLSNELKNSLLNGKQRLEIHHDQNVYIGAWKLSLLIPRMIGLVFLIQQALPKWWNLVLLLSSATDLKSFSKFFSYFVGTMDIQWGGVTLFFLKLCPLRHLLVHQVGDNVTVIKQKWFS